MPVINNWGHIGGMVGGVLLGTVLGYNEKKRQNATHRLMAEACALATIAALAWGLLRGLRYLI